MPVPNNVQDGSENYRRTEDPQRVDSSRADAEWKADPGLDNLTHGTDSKGSEVDRSRKATGMPEGLSEVNDRIASGGGSEGGPKGWTGDGKGPLNPEEWRPKREGGQGTKE